MNFVPCLAWVCKGVAKALPDKVQLSADELKKLVDEAKEWVDDNASDDWEDVEEDEEENSSTESLNEKEEENDDDQEINAKYDLDNYDDDDERPFVNIHDVAVHVDNTEDSYITDLKAVNEDEKDEEADFRIKVTDNLLVVGHVEDESSVLEIYVYNKDEDSFYVHHDIVLPSFPLALEWLDFNPSEETPGNYIAVGDMSPVVKVYDLDLVDVLEPDYTLGKEVKKKKKIKLEYHSDAVISLSWNKSVRNLLASGSADSSIILWDLQEVTVMKKLEFHTGKVQSVVWHPFESSFLLSGCTDGLIRVFDCRADATDYKSWNVEGEVEKMCWNLHDSLKFFCSTDTGYVHCIDMKDSEVVFSVQAHTEGVTALEMSPEKPNMLVTTSMDKQMKLWNVEEELKLMKSFKLKVGSIYSAKLNPDFGTVAAVGGNNASNSLKVLDLAKKLEEDDVPEVVNESSLGKSKKKKIKPKKDKSRLRK